MSLTYTHTMIGADGLPKTYVYAHINPDIDYPSYMRLFRCNVSSKSREHLCVVYIQAISMRFILKHIAAVRGVIRSITSLQEYDVLNLNVEHNGMDRAPQDAIIIPRNAYSFDVSCFCYDAPISDIIDILN